MNHIYDEGGLPGERSRYKNCPEDCNLGCPECWEEEEEEVEEEEDGFDILPALKDTKND